MLCTVGCWESWQHLRLYKDGHHFVTAHTHGDFIVLPARLSCQHQDFISRARSRWLISQSAGFPCGRSGVQLQAESKE